MQGRSNGLSVAQAVTHGWINECTDALASSSAHIAHEDRWRWAVQPAEHRCVRLPLLLVSEGLDPQSATHGSGLVPGLQGHLAWLTLALLPSPNAGLALAPLPSSSTLPLETTWVRALEDVRAGLQPWLTGGPGGDAPAAWQDWAIGWDVCPQAGQFPIAMLGGRSAAASLTLGVLKLLHNQAWLNDAVTGRDWACLLAGLRTHDLRHVWLSADISWPVGGEPQLLPVEPRGLQAKAQALWSHHPEACLHGAQALLGPDGKPVVPPHYRQAQGWSALLHQLGADQGFTLPQARLHNALMAQSPETYQGQTQRTRLLRNADMVQVAATSPSTYAQAALCQFAEWEQRSQGPVTQWMVPLELKVDEVSPRFKEPGEKFKTRWGGLDELLAEEPRGQHYFVLQGPAGAGKSTLLRHAMQTRCWQALRAWQSGQQPEELLLYLPLNELEAKEKDLLAWARQQVHEAKMGPWADAALSGGPAEPWWPRRWRWVLDGLNELKVTLDPQNPAGLRGARSTRAKALVTALQAALPAQHKALPLLSSRPHHLTMPDALTVELQEWHDENLLSYLRHRFGEGQADKHMAALRAQPQTLALARRPLMLAGLADVLEEGWQGPDGQGQLPDNRALVYAAWLWQRLRREVGCATAPGSPRVKNEDVQALLSPSDLARIEAPDVWRTQTLALPTEGPLLKAYMEQGEAQYWPDSADDADTEAAAAPGTPSKRPGSHNCDVAVPWAAVQPASLGPGQREVWGRAMAALGLAEFTEHSFKFSHQSFGEHAASLRLLATPPQALEAQAQAGNQQAQATWRRLFEGCAPPDVPEPVAELTRQRRAFAQRWAAVLTPERLAALNDEQGTGALSRRLSVTFAEFCRRRKITVDPSLDEAGPSAREAVLKSPYGHLLGHDGRPPVVAYEQREGVCWVHPLLRAWGDLYGVQRSLDSTLGADPGADADADKKKWHARAEGWADFVRGWLQDDFREQFWTWLKDDGVPLDELDTLQQDGGGLPSPDVAVTQDVLTLALLGQPDPCPWLARLLASPLWRATVPAALALRGSLEPPEWRGVAPAPAAGPAEDPAFAQACDWLAGHWARPHPLLQHLRQRLLLDSVDAGPGVKHRLEASGLLALLQAGQPAPEATPQPRPQPALPPVPPLAAADAARLAQAWQAAWAQAFQGPGVRLQLRLQSAHWLGELGDNLRYQRARHPQDPRQRGLLLRAPLWAAVRGSGAGPTPQVHFVAGSNEGRSLECRAEAMSLPGFALPCYPTVVAEYACYLASGGMAAQATWWQGVGLQHWRAGPGQGRTQPGGWGDAARRNPLLPVVGLTWWEALAFTRWAAALRPLGAAPHPVALGRLSLPSELEMQAAARWPAPQQPWQDAYPFNPEALPPGLPLNLAFNHIVTRLGRLAPVGMFSTALGQLGVEQCGNAYTWCRNLAVKSYSSAEEQARALRPAPDSDTKSARALVGGSFNDTADNARVAYRYHTHPDGVRNNVGVRWVLLPHSDC